MAKGKKNAVLSSDKSSNTEDLVIEVAESTECLFLQSYDDMCMLDDGPLYCRTQRGRPKGCPLHFRRIIVCAKAE